MKKNLIPIIPTASIFVLIVIIGVYFIEDISNIFKLSKTMNSSVVTDSNIKTIVGLSLVGFVAFIRKRSPKK